MPSAQHSSQHPAPGADHQGRKKVIPEILKSMIDQKGQQRQQDKIEGPRQQSPEKPSLPRSLPGKKTGQKGCGRINHHNPDVHRLPGKLETIQKQRQKQQRPSCQKIGRQQAFP